MSDTTPVIIKKMWTPEEDALLARKISESPNNISYACDQAALELNRTSQSVSQRYYSYLRKNSEPIHTLSSDKGFVNNIKNTRRPVEEDVDPMTIILENFSRLTRRQAKAILEIFNH